jgi:hypothetical protein
MGGWKASGIGYRHGAIGIRKYCRSESILVSRLSPKRELFWHPYGPRRRNLVRRMFRLFSARGLGRRLGRD